MRISCGNARMMLAVAMRCCCIRRVVVRTWERRPAGMSLSSLPDMHVCMYIFRWKELLAGNTTESWLPMGRAILWSVISRT